MATQDDPCGRIADLERERDSLRAELRAAQVARALAEAKVAEQVSMIANLAKALRVTDLAHAEHAAAMGHAQARA